MDEVDKIILSSLSEIGYVTKDNVTNLKLYSFEQQVSMVICCLKAIRPEMAFPSSLPPTMSARYNICAQFAQICKELGYKKDVGYHTFMYQNSSDIRQVLIFLVEHLPKRTSFEQPDESKTRDVTIRQRISEELKNIFAVEISDSEPYGVCKAPFVSAFLETGTLLPNQKIDCKPLEWRDFVAQELPFIDEQLPDSRCFLPSVIALNARGLVNPTIPKCSKFSLSSLNSNFYRALSASSGSGGRGEVYSSGSSADASDAQLPQYLDRLEISDTTPLCTDRNGSQSALQSEEDKVVVDLEKEIDEINLHITTLNAKLNEISQNNDTLRKKLKEKISHESSLQQSIALLPDSENNIPKLEAANEKCKAKILKLESQWNRHKNLLLNKRAELRTIVDQKVTEKNKLIQSIMELRRELFDAMEEVQKRTSVEQRLSELELGDSVKRSEYITRIIEIIKNLEKQREQIGKILHDMRFIQKEINNLSGKVGRSFAVVEKLVVSQMSPTDELSRETHKMILLLHKDFNELLAMIEETGKYARDIKDLEDQLMESGNHVENALKQVTTDLTRLKEEQTSLVSQIAKYTGVDEEPAQLTATPETKKSSLKPSFSSDSAEKSKRKAGVKFADAEPHRERTRSKDSEPGLEIIMPLFSNPVTVNSSPESDFSDDVAEAFVENVEYESQPSTSSSFVRPGTKQSSSGASAHKSKVRQAVSIYDDDDST